MLDKRNFYINGKWISPLKSDDFEVINPSNEESCAIISLGGDADVNSAVKAAKEALENLDGSDSHAKHCLLWNRDWFNKRDLTAKPLP